MYCHLPFSVLKEGQIDRWGRWVGGKNRPEGGLVHLNIQDKEKETNAVHPYRIKRIVVAGSSYGNEEMKDFQSEHGKTIGR